MPAPAEKMKQGIPLTDEDRAPWLHELAGLISTSQAHGKRIVMGCSALKEAYREILRGQRADSVLFVSPVTLSTTDRAPLEASLALSALSSQLPPVRHAEHSDWCLIISRQDISYSLGLSQ